MLSNTTALRDTWTRLSREFEALYKRRAFVHYYTNEGMQQEDFASALETVNNLCDAYNREHPR